MSDERRQILTMLAENKITVDEAERLLKAIDQTGDAPSAGAGSPQAESAPDADFSSTSFQCLDGAVKGSQKKPKYLYIRVMPKHDEGKQAERVNIRVPLIVLRAGLKFGGILPNGAKEKIRVALGEKGIDLGKLDEHSFNDIIEGLNELSIDIDDKDERVTIYCE